MFISQVRESLWQPVLISGAERLVTMIIGFSALQIFLAGKSFISFLIAVFLWKCGMYFARKAAKKDGQLMAIFMRYSSYKIFYPATEKQVTRLDKVKVCKEMGS